MKTLRLTIALIYALAGLPSFGRNSELASDLMKQSEFLKLSEQPFSRMWEALKPFLSKEDVKQFDAFVKSNPDLKIPSMSATKMTSQKDGEVIRVIMQYKTDMITIDFQDSPQRIATVNGVSFSLGETQSFNQVYKRLAASDLGLKEMAWSAKSHSDQKFSMSILNWLWNLAVPNSQAQAQPGRCMNRTANICWDQITGSFEERQTLLKKQVDNQNLSNSDLKDIASTLRQDQKNCDAKKCPFFQALMEREALIQSLISNGKDQSPAEKSSRSKKTANTKGNGSPAESEEAGVSSWLKPLALIAAGGLVLWGLCSKKVIRIFSCGKSSSSSSTAGLPSSNPSNPIYSGTGTE